MASSIYSEVTSVSTGVGYERDRVLDKLVDATKDLPYTVDDITISHNDFAVADVINDSIRKLYLNYIFLIANSEIISESSPTDSLSTVSVNTNYTPAKSAITTTPTNTLSSLSAYKETLLVNKTDSTDKLTLFNYAVDNSVVLDCNTDLSSVAAILSGNEVEFNKTFVFREIVSADTSDTLLFVLDRGSNTCYKFDISGLITNDTAIKRTGVTDEKRPGRYLLKTIGGSGSGETKNKLDRPSGLSIHDNKIYILDNGHSSIKIFDLNFNFINELHIPNIFNNVNYGEPVSIVVDQISDTNTKPRGYILTSRGKIVTYNIDKNTAQEPKDLFSFYDTRLQVLSAKSIDDTFFKIVNSKVKKNVIYIANVTGIYKYYKTHLDNFADQLDIEGVGGPGLEIGTEDNQLQILSFDTEKHNNKEYIVVTARKNGTGEIINYFFIDEHITTKLYHDNFYTNYFTLSSINILPQEVVNNINLNKTFKKLSYNHYSFFENLNKKVYSYYKISRNSMYPSLCTVVPHSFTTPTELQDDKNLYIGVNEPLLTDVVNRPLKALYNQQVALFNLIQEERLNSNPPVDYTIHLPGDTEVYPNVVSTQSDITSAGGQFIPITITRTNLLTSRPECSFRYWTTLGPNTLSSDISYIDVKNKSVGVFKKNEDTQTIDIRVKHFYSGTKSFFLNIEPNSDCIIDDDVTAVNLTANPDFYNVSLSASTGTVIEGGKYRIGVVRQRADGVGIWYDPDFDSSSVNIKITPSSNIAIDEYTPNVAGGSVYTYTFSDVADFPGTSVTKQASAKEVGNRSTITFTEDLTSIVFDLSASTDVKERRGEFFTVEITNPSTGTSLINPTKQIISLTDDIKTASLHVRDLSGSYRADGTSTTLLSNINIWEALSANTEYRAYSATHPFNVDFTISDPISVFSVDTASAAVMFDARGHADVISTGNTQGALPITNNTLTINVSSGAAIVGKAGDGGHGRVWLSGADYSFALPSNDDIDYKDYGEKNNIINGGIAIGDVPAVVATITPTGFDETGAAVSMETIDVTNNINMFVDNFSILTINNAGKIYGGAGGGAGGLPAVSASTMDHVSALSAGSGGGGGAGIHIKNRGLAGLAANYYNGSTFTQDSNYTVLYLQDGSAGGVDGTGGTGGGFTNTGSYPTVTFDGGTVDITTYGMMSGTDGGALGVAGESDTTIAGPTDGSSINNVSNRYKLREGGSAGTAIDHGNKTVNNTGTILP